MQVDEQQGWVQGPSESESIHLSGPQLEGALQTWREGPIWGRVWLRKEQVTLGEKGTDFSLRDTFDAHYYAY